MTGWIKSGVIAWIDGHRREDETVLLYVKGVGLTDLAEALNARHRPAFARGGEVAPGEWGVLVHPMYNPARDDYAPVDYRELCPPGAELVVFVPNPSLAQAHGPHAYHFKDGRAVSCVDYEAPAYVGEYWPNELAPVITAAGLASGGEDFEGQDSEREDY
ncbi:hypothetical protein ABZ990_07175 [Streptomyces sp. NPDC046203]|uniref:hypothetical protein n=1 Tax=Streptomyces sp. NPDC046203 TaxID=3154602 RepID=UPI0033EE46F1